MEEGQKTVRAGRQEGRGQTMTAGHDRGTASINSQDLWLPAQDLQDIQPVIVLAWRQAHEPSALTEEPSELMASRS